LRQVSGWKDPLLYAAAVAGCGDEEIARLVIEVGSIIGQQQLQEAGFKFEDAVMAR
jgi:hypothetical protein